MDEEEKERLRDEGRRAERREFESKITSALAWGFGGAAVGGGFFVGFFNLPETAVLIAGAIAACYGWNGLSGPWH